MSKFLFTIFISFWVLKTNTFAQLSKVSDDAFTKSNYPMSLNFQPIFLLNNTLKFDVEVQQKNKASAFIVGLEAISGNTSLLYYKRNDDKANDHVVGAGISLAYKLKFNPTEKITSFYFSTGLTLRKMNITTRGEDFYSYLDNGIEYFTYGDVEKKYPVESALLFGNIGYHKVWKDNVLIDLYLGYSYKMSSEDDLLLKNRNYEEPVYGFNYNGVALQVGIKFGYQIKR